MLSRTRWVVMAGLAIVLGGALPAMAQSKRGQGPAVERGKSSNADGDAKVTEKELRQQDSKEEDAAPVVKPLLIGDAVPAIGDRAEWLKGDPLKSFDDGNIYVIDLWATWCGPCITAMPHIDNVARTYAPHNVQVIGLALDPGQAMPTDEFVKKHSDTLNYMICEDIDDQLYDEYFRRTRSVGIPRALIVNRKGVLAWVGDPRDMRGPLAEIVLGTYDIDQARASDRRNAETKSADSSRGGRAGGDFLDRFVAAQKEHDGETMVEIARGILKNTDASNPKTRRVNYRSWLAEGLYFQGKHDEAIKVAKSLAQEPGYFKRQVMCGAAEFFIVERSDDPGRNLRVAIEIAEAAIDCNDEGQEWPCEGCLVFVLDAVEKYVKGNRPENIKDGKFLKNKLNEYSELRASRPRESSSTQISRKKAFGAAR